MGPRGLTPAQVAYWEGTFRKLVQIDEFKQDVERNFWETNYRGSADMAKYLKAEHEELRALLSDIGMAKR